VEGHPLKRIIQLAAILILPIAGCEQQQPADTAKGGRYASGIIGDYDATTVQQASVNGALFKTGMTRAQVLAELPKAKVPVNPRWRIRRPTDRQLKRDHWRLHYGSEGLPPQGVIVLRFSDDRVVAIEWLKQHFDIVEPSDAVP